MADTSVTQQVKRFFDDYPVKTFSKGEMVMFADGKQPPVMYLVSGMVAQYDISDQGHKQILNVFKPGAFFPMAQAVNELPNRYFFEATEPVEVRVAPAAEVVTFVRQSPEVLFDLLQRVYRGVEGILGKLSHLMNDTAQGTLLFELGIMAERFGTHQPDGIFVKTTTSRLGEQTGLARETVSRELQKAIQSGLVETKTGGILLKRPTKGKPSIARRAGQTAPT